MWKEDKKAKSKACKKTQKGNESQHENRFQQMIINIKNESFIQHIRHHFFVRFTIAQR